MCGKVVESTAYSVAKFCRNNKCQHEYYSKNRTGKKNPAYRNGLSMKDKHAKTYGGNHYRACSNYRKVFLEKNQYLFCEVCKVNQNGAKRFEVHHIYYASRYPKHKELHNHKNLIMLCISCHNNFHSGVYKDKFKELEKERGLKKLFEKRLCNISSK
jgi:predicted HNH restriction endonuclease